MHPEVLTLEQKNLLPLIKKFAKDFGLVGGTAVALQIGHRRSIDFDLFTLKPFDRLKIRKKIVKNHTIEKILQDKKDEYTLLVDGVKLTFLEYPFAIKFGIKFNDIIAMPKLPTLAALKAYALGRRSKWKDYVDLYFILQDFPLTQIIQKARVIFGNEFNEKLFRAQLAYFDDIDYSESVEHLPGFARKDVEIKKFLTKVSLTKQ